MVNNLLLLILLMTLVGTPWGFADDSSQEVLTSHGFSLYGEPDYGADFSAFKYVDAKAPKGGKIRLPALGTYDTLNPYVLKGISASAYTHVYGITELNEPLMIGTGGYLKSGDEPQTAYCLLCKSITYPKDHSWVIFTLDKRARFHNGDPITSKDVAHSYQLLISDQAHPSYGVNFSMVDRVEILNPQQVKFYFKPNSERSSILRVGELPVMSHQFWAEHEFGGSSGIPQPLSGPYKIKQFRLGDHLVLERVAEFWAKDHPAYQGMFNFDEVRFDFYRDRTVAFEAFKSGSLDFWIEYVSKNWLTNYDFPALHQGKVIKEQVEHNIPANTQAFFMNTRRSIFQDRRVREALAILFDYNWVNKNIFGGAYRRESSYYSNSLMASEGLPSQAELALLKPLKDQLPEPVLTESFSYPIYENSRQLRQGLKRALSLLKEAGWRFQGEQLVQGETGAPFEFEFLVNNPSFQRVMMQYASVLKKAGIKMNIRIVDTAQYKVRLDENDFDMTVYVLGQPAMPGHEQKIYFHSSQADVRGSRNLAGIKNPAIDHLLETALNAASEQELQIAVKALDRVLLWNHYSILNWYSGYHRIAYQNKFARPAQRPDYILGFHTWWLDAAGQ